MTLSIRIAGGSARGRAHRRAFRNNQDGFALRAAAGAAIGVVTDGCGSGFASEIGARLGAARVASRGLALLAEHGPCEALARAVVEDLEAALEGWLTSIAGASERVDALASAFLFSLLVVATDPRGTVVFGVGDGVVVADGRVLSIDPGPDNAPPYLAYRLLGRPAEPVVHACFARPTRVAIGSDGAAPLFVGPERLRVDDSRLFRTSAALGRHLAARSLRDPQMQDDATLVIVDAGGGS